MIPEGTPVAACSACCSSGARADGSPSQPRARATATSKAALEDSPAPAGPVLDTRPSKPATGRRTGTTEAISQAREVAGIDGHALAEPNLMDGLVDGDPAARSRIDSVVRQRILSERVVRVKVWTSTGHIAYSDEPRLIGRTFDLGPGE